MAAELLPFQPTGDPGDEYVWTPFKGPALEAFLVTRLAEAADGIRNGEQIWWIAQLKRQPPAGYDIIGYFNSPEHAYQTEPAKLESGEYMIFGPYQTKDDPDYVPKQVKTVVLILKSGEEICLDGETYDCVFWSLSVFDKFVGPYYRHIGDDQEAKYVRDQFKNALHPAGIHIPGSQVVYGASSHAASPCIVVASKNRVGPQLLTPNARPEGPDAKQFIPL